MTYLTALEAPARQQWETSSAPSQSYNCGPTSAAKIDTFYKDRRLSIDYVRRLAAPEFTATSALQLATMLDKLGTPATPRGLGLDGLKAIVSNRARPVAVVLNMEAVPYSVKGEPFAGRHWVVVMGNTKTATNVTGVWVMDPNFSPPGGIRPDPEHGIRFYPDSVMHAAMTGDACVPDRGKVIAVNKATVTPIEFVPAGPRRANIPRGGTIHAYSVAHPGGPVMVRSFPNGSGFSIARKVRVTWSVTNVVPHGTFGVAADGIFAGLLILLSEVKAADGKPW